MYCPFDGCDFWCQVDTLPYYESCPKCHGSYSFAKPRPRPADPDPGHWASEDALDELRSRLYRLESWLHARCLHPDYEYRTTEGPRKAWDCEPDLSAEGWEQNTEQGRGGWERFDHHEEMYWRRPRALLNPHP